MANKELQAVDEIIHEERITEQELEQLAAHVDDLYILKSKLPMFYTGRGNVVKVPSFKVTDKNFMALSADIESARVYGKRLCCNTQNFLVVLSSEISDELRRLGQIEILILSGWRLFVEGA